MPLTGRSGIPQIMQSGARMNPDEGWMGAALVMLKLAMAWIPTYTKQGFLSLRPSYPPSEKRGCWKPAKLQGQNPCKSA